MSQLSIFDILYDRFQPKDKIRLIELFAGYGSQYLACKYLGLGDRVEHYRICEWATKSIQAYNDLHVRDYTDYASWKSMDYIYDYLYEKGISLDYNSPMTLDQIKRKGESWCKTTYNNIIATKNLVNITKVKAADLCIEDTDKYTYIMTYSFPCQDLSLAGLTKGMEKGSGTRSGLLWEVERILEELDNKHKPQVLLMENVTQVHGAGNEKSFSAWVKKLEELGYSNYIQDMIATDYCIPQTRDRTFMVSILGNYTYSFPMPMKPIICLKDLLEKNVDEKYFLSDKIIKFFIANETKQKEKGNGFRFNVSDGNVIAKTITTRAGSRMDDNFIADYNTCNNKRLEETIANNLDKLEDGAVIDSYNNVIKNDGKMITVTTRTIPSNNTFIAIKNKTKKGYLLAEDGDGVDISGRMQYHRGTVQKGKAQTLSTMGGENAGVCVKTIGNYTPSNHNASRIVDSNYAAPTVMENHGTITAVAVTKNYIQWKEDGYHDLECRAYFEDKVAPTTTTTPKGKILQNDLRIRKLTTKECWRLMGVKDKDFNLVCKNQSDASLYHLAGDSIVTSVLIGVFGELLHINNYKQKILELIQELKEEKE